MLTKLFAFSYQYIVRNTPLKAYASYKFSFGKSGPFEAATTESLVSDRYWMLDTRYWKRKMNFLYLLSSIQKPVSSICHNCKINLE